MSQRMQSAVATGDGPLLLVVADDLTHRSIVGRMVRALGFRHRSCAGSTVALQYLREHPRQVRLLLADLALSRMDGGELAERARDLDPRLQVVLMVGATDPHVDALIAGYGDVPFITKPVSFSSLASVVLELAKFDQPLRHEATRA